MPGQETDDRKGFWKRFYTCHLSLFLANSWKFKFKDGKVFNVSYLTALLWEQLPVDGQPILLATLTAGRVLALAKVRRGLVLPNTHEGQSVLIPRLSALQFKAALTLELYGMQKTVLSYKCQLIETDRSGLLTSRSSPSIGHVLGYLVELFIKVCHGSVDSHGGKRISHFPEHGAEVFKCTLESRSVFLCLCLCRKEFFFTRNLGDCFQANPMPEKEDRNAICGPILWSKQLWKKHGYWRCHKYKCPLEKTISKKEKSFFCKKAYEIWSEMNRPWEWE